ncbi:MAG TPA: hypothetical protein VK553_06180 [Candidatus Nitrosopolaris rasttigaisensis]|nr:hypothetical protein [Candidatus Nitrosopolaris rasttigaisensis]
MTSIKQEIDFRDLQVERTSAYVERKENEGNRDYKINNTRFREENRQIELLIIYQFLQSLVQSIKGSPW